MQVSFEPRLASVLTGLSITFESSDDVTHLLYALRSYRSNKYPKWDAGPRWGETWPWLDEFIAGVEAAKAQGKTGIIGPFIKETCKCKRSLKRK